MVNKQAKTQRNTEGVLIEQKNCNNIYNQPKPANEQAQMMRR